MYFSLLLCIIITSCNSLSRPHLPMMNNKHKVVFNAIEYTESWEDGEVAWDIVNSNTALFSVQTSALYDAPRMSDNKHVYYHPKRQDTIESMSDGEVPWDSSEIVTYDELSSDKDEIWKWIERSQNQDPKLLFMEMYEKFISKEDIIMDFQGTTLIMFILFSFFIMQKEEGNRGTKKKMTYMSNPVTMLCFSMGLVLTKNVHSAS